MVDKFQALSPRERVVLTAFKMGGCRYTDTRESMTVWWVMGAADVTKEVVKLRNHGLLTRAEYCDATCGQVLPGGMNLR
jgi:hypothetical protein